jgi:glutamate synthase (NADPH/NADH) large chain
MVTLVPVLPEALQREAEADLALAGKGRKLHRGEADEPLLRGMIERHLRYTGSTVALALLDRWEQARARFVKVFPNEYQRALAEMYAAVPTERTAARAQKQAA